MAYDYLLARIIANNDAVVCVYARRFYIQDIRASIPAFYVIVRPIVIEQVAKRVIDLLVDDDVARGVDDGCTAHFEIRRSRTTSAIEINARAR